MLRRLALTTLATVFGAALLADVLAPAEYAVQHREKPDAQPSWQHPLGTDALGRDRLSRLLHGSRVSLLLAPAAGLLCVIAAALVGGAAGCTGGWCDRTLMAATDLMLSIPWLFLLITVRAMLPLDTGPWMSVSITFLLLAALGWAGSARVVRTAVGAIRRSDFLLQARACGCSPVRLFVRHIAPNLRPVLAAQFWTTVPAFIVSEANLGLLGLGVAEPLPSLGNLLRELDSLAAIEARPWIITPAVLIVLVVLCLEYAIPKREVSG
jgi:peptide/nickel transport system permease protein